MKTVLAFSILILLSFSNVQAEEVKFPNNPLGLVAQLAEWKNDAEMQLAEILNCSDANLDHNQRIRDYVEIKKGVDKIILQLEADLIRKNCLSRYKKIDNYFKKDATVSIEPSYLAQLKSINDNMAKFKYSCKTPKRPAIKKEGGALDIISTVLDGIEKIGTIVNDAAERRAAKIESLNKILDALRLASPSDLKPKKEDN